MSKAFTKDDAAEAEVVVAPRAPLPPDAPNYVTRRGLEALRAEHARLHDERTAIAGDGADAAHARAALTARIEALDERLASAELVDASAQPHDTIRFGATATLRAEDGSERRWRIVGVDEADVKHGLVAFVAPLARAVLGKRAGDVVTMKTPRGEEELEVIAVEYEE